MPHKEGTGKDTSGGHKYNDMVSQGELDSKGTTSADSSPVGQAGTGMGNPGTGHALARPLPPPGMPTMDGDVITIRHTHDVQMPPTLDPTVFSDFEGGNAKYRLDPLQTGWWAPPTNMNNFYMTNQEIDMIQRDFDHYEYLEASVVMSNFQTHTVAQTGVSVPQWTVNTSGVMFQSLICNAKELGCPYTRGSDIEPEPAWPLPTQTCAKPVAFSGKNEREPGLMQVMKARYVTPEHWYLYLIGVPGSMPYWANAAGNTGIGALDTQIIVWFPDLNRLAARQQNSPVHSAFHTKCNMGVQSRKFNEPNSGYHTGFINNQNTDVPPNPASDCAILPNAYPNIKDQTNGIPNATRGTVTSATANNWHYTNFCPNTWQSPYERICEGRADEGTTYAQHEGNSSDFVRGSHTATTGGEGPIKDFWAMRALMPDLPDGNAIPVIVCFQVETEIKIKVGFSITDRLLNGLVGGTSTSSGTYVNVGLDRYRAPRSFYDNLVSHIPPAAGKPSNTTLVPRPTTRSYLFMTPAPLQRLMGKRYHKRPFMRSWLDGARMMHGHDKLGQGDEAWNLTVEQTAPSNFSTAVNNGNSHSPYRT